MDISGNSLSHISNLVRNLLTLQCLNIADNRIERFPYAIGCIPCLRILHCQRNPFQNIDMSVLSGSSADALAFIRSYDSSHLEEVDIGNEAQESTEQTFVFSLEFIISTPPYYDSYVKGSTNSNYKPSKSSRHRPAGSTTRFHILNESRIQLLYLSLLPHPLLHSPHCS